MINNWNNSYILDKKISCIMTEANQIRKEICQKYLSMCQKISHIPNGSLVKYLSTPTTKSFYLDIIFRGNDKLNFTSRLTDRDIILLTRALDGYENVRGGLRRLFDILIFRTMNCQMQGLRFLLNVWKIVLQQSVSMFRGMLQGRLVLIKLGQHFKILNQSNI